MSLRWGARSSSTEMVMQDLESAIAIAKVCPPRVCIAQICIRRVSNDSSAI